eukprot:236280-Pleurochrysis_carterae.AAC.1
MVNHHITYHSTQESGLATRRALSELERGARPEPTQKGKRGRASARRQIDEGTKTSGRYQEAGGLNGDGVGREKTEEHDGAGRASAR